MRDCMSSWMAQVMQLLLKVEKVKTKVNDNIVKFPTQFKLGV